VSLEISAENASPRMLKAMSTLISIKKELQRTNTVSLADLVAFGGAEALETVGSPRVTVQVGRFDSKSTNPNPKILPWINEPASQVKSIFFDSSLDSQQLVLLLGSLGEIQRVVDETLFTAATAQSSEEDDDDDEQQKIFVPTTFGARDAIFGAKMGKADFGSKFLTSVLKNKVDDPSLKKIAACLLADGDLKSYVQKYASNEAAFLKDVPSAYLKLTLLGESYTTRNS